MGEEFIVFSNLNGQDSFVNSVNINDDRNDWNFGTKDLDLGYIQDLNCVSRAGMFTTLSRATNGSRVLGVWWGNNQY